MDADPNASAKFNARESVSYKAAAQSGKVRNARAGLDAVQAMSKMGGLSAVTEAPEPAAKKSPPLPGAAGAKAA